MSSKRTRSKARPAAETHAPASAGESGAAETDLDENDFAGESVGRLEESLDALDAEFGPGEPEDEDAGAFDTDPAGGLGADDEGDEEAEAATDDEPPAFAAEVEAGAEEGDSAVADDAGSAARVEAADVEAIDVDEDEDAAADGEDEDDDDDEADDADEAGDVVIFDADAEDREEELARRAAELKAAAEAAGGPEAADDEVAPGGKPRELAELLAVCEALIFVSEEPLTTKAIADVLGEDKGWVEVAIEQLASEFNERNGGLMLREVAGGWQFATRPEHHEHIRAYLKSKPSAKLSLAALETLAVIAYKQPVTVPEILEIRGVQSSSAIKTLLDKRLIVAKGRKEVVGRPMMYGTSKEFLLQFGLRDLSELPSIEDFEDLAAGES